MPSEWPDSQEQQHDAGPPARDYEGAPCEWPAAREQEALLYEWPAAGTAEAAACGQPSMREQEAVQCGRPSTPHTQQAPSTYDAHELLHGRGGIICVAAEALPRLHLDAPALLRGSNRQGLTTRSIGQHVLRSSILPQATIDFDVVGRVAVTGAVCKIECAEIKSTLDYGTAVDQLGVRIAVLKWLARVVYELDAEVVFDLHGYLMVPRSALPADQLEVDKQQASRAKGLYGYTLHLRVM